MVVASSLAANSGVDAMIPGNMGKVRGEEAEKGYIRAVRPVVWRSIELPRDKIPITKTFQRSYTAVKSVQRKKGGGGQGRRREIADL